MFDAFISICICLAVCCIMGCTTQSGDDDSIFPTPLVPEPTPTPPTPTPPIPQPVPVSLSLSLGLCLSLQIPQKISRFEI